MDREPDDTHETTDRREVDLITAEARKQGHRVKVNARRVEGVVTYSLRFWAAEGARGEIDMDAVEDDSAEAPDVPVETPEPAPPPEETPKPKKATQKAPEPDPEPDII